MPIVLAALAPVMTGLLALILIVAVGLLVDVLARAIDWAPLPSLIQRALKTFVYGVLAIVHIQFAWLGWVAQGVVGLFTAPARAFLNLVNALQTTLWTFAARLRYILFQAIPNLWSGILSSVANAVRNLTALAVRLHAAAIAFTYVVRAQLYAAIAAAVAVATTYALTLHRLVVAALARLQADIVAWVLGLVRYIERAIAATAAHVVRLILTVRAELFAHIENMIRWAVATAIGVAVDQARRYTDALIGALGRALDAAAGLALAPAWPHILDAIGAIARAIPGSLTDILIRAGALPRVMPRDLAKVLGIAIAIGAIGVDWIKRCGVPLCRNVLGFSDELAALEEELLIAELLALVARAVADPRDTAVDIRDTMAGPLTSISRDFTSILATVE